MPLINFSGIASGIDSNALIQATSDVTRATRVKPNENKIKDLEDTNTAVESLKGKVKTLQDIAFRFSSSQAGGVVKTASSTDETKISASAANSAINGSYTLTVATLAKSATFSFKNADTPASLGAYASSSAAINPYIVTPSNVTVAIGTGSDQTTFNIAVDSTTTLSTFVTNFNNSTSKAVATLVNVGTSASPDYRIVVTGSNEGTTKGAVSITIPTEVSDPDGNALHRAWNDNTDVPATDATFTMSGIGGTITRSSNSVSDIIPGVTFNLKDDGGAEATITVRDDVAGTTSKLQEFVNAYNDIIAFIHDNDFITRQEQGSNILNSFGPLANTSIDNNLLTSLRNGLSNGVYLNTGDSGTATNEIRVLADLGIKTNKDAYSKESRSGGGTLTFTSSSTDPTVFDLQDALSKEPASVNEILKKLGDALGSQASGILKQYTQFNGLFDTSITSNKNQITDLNKRIATAEASITKQEEMMRARFARLESTIGQMQNQQSALSSALASLPRNS